VPLLEDVVVVDEPPPRVTALEPEDEDPPDDEPPDELDPDDPLDGGAERTGCCSEYEGAVYDGAEYDGAATGAGGGGDSRGIACVALATGAGGGADSVVGGADLGTAWAAAGCGASSSATVPPAAKVSIKPVCVRISLPPEPYSATLLPSFNAA